MSQILLHPAVGITVELRTAVISGETTSIDKTWSLLKVIPAPALHNDNVDFSNHIAYGSVP